MIILKIYSDRWKISTLCCKDASVISVRSIISNWWVFNFKADLTNSEDYL